MLPARNPAKLQDGKTRVEINPMTTKTKAVAGAAKTSKQKTVYVLGVHRLVKHKGRASAVATSPKKSTLRELLKFNRALFARLIPVSERSLADIEKGKPASEPVRRSIAQLERLVSALEEVVEPSAIGDWLKHPNSAFDGLKPLEVIERGEIDRIWQMIYQLRSGVAF